MATTTELYQVSLEFLLQRLGQTDSPIAPEAYRRFRGELSIGEKRDVILFTKVRQAPLRDYLDQATLQALWHRQTPVIAKVIWEIARDILQRTFGMDINDDGGLESLGVDDICIALQNHLSSKGADASVPPTDSRTGAPEQMNVDDVIDLPF
jgi:hypothetical protein